MNRRIATGGGSVYRLLWSSWKSIIKKLDKLGDEGQKFLTEPPRKQLEFYKHLAMAVAHRGTGKIRSPIGEKWLMDCSRDFPAVTGYALPRLSKRLLEFSAPAKRESLYVLMGWGPREPSKTAKLSAAQSSALFQSRQAAKEMKAMGAPAAPVKDIFAELEELAAYKAKRDARVERDAQAKRDAKSMRRSKKKA